MPPSRVYSQANASESAKLTSATSVGSPMRLPAVPLTVLQTAMHSSSFFSPPRAALVSLARTGSAPEKSVTISSTVMRFSVRVPVLSEQIQLHPPSVSTAWSLRTMARSRLIFCTPSAMMTVTMAGMPSGIAATAIATDDMKLPKRVLSLKKMPNTKMTAATEMTNAVMTLPSTARIFSSGVFAVSVFSRRSAILPISVSLPVRTTTAFACPLTTNDEEYSMFLRSKTPVFSSHVPAFLVTPTDSPVSADSSHLSSSARRTRQSAGTMSPSSRSMTSPGTRRALSSSRSLPPRTVLTRHTESDLSFSMALSARYC